MTLISDTRALIPDTGAVPMFSDAEITSYLTLNEDNPFLAAAQALDVLVTQSILTGGSGVKVRTDDLSVDDTAQLKALQDRIIYLRDQGSTAAFEIVYPAYTHVRPEATPAW